MNLKTFCKELYCLSVKESSEINGGGDGGWYDIYHAIGNGIASFLRGNPDTTPYDGYSTGSYHGQP